MRVCLKGPRWKGILLKRFADAKFNANDAAISGSSEFLLVTKEVHSVNYPVNWMVINRSILEERCLS